MTEDKGANGVRFDEQVRATAFAGGVKARLQSVETKVDAMARDVTAIKGKVDQAAGAWKTLSVIGATLGMIGTFLSVLVALGVIG